MKINATVFGIREAHFHVPKGDCPTQQVGFVKAIKLSFLEIDTENGGGPFKWYP